MTTDYKLANVVLRVEEHAKQHPEIYYHINAGNVSYDEQHRSLDIKGDVDFLTYVNGFSACKWRKYTEIAVINLHIEAYGSGRVVARGVPIAENEPVLITQVPFAAKDDSAALLDIEIDADKYDFVGFSVISDGASSVRLMKAFYSCRVAESDINKVNLALSTTTFKNERYILPNIELVKNGIGGEDGPIRDHFHMFVVDNGSTLDADGLTCEMVTVLPNPNTGGSGGFARGMMAVTEKPGEFTHIILMDDDVSIMPESLIRTFNLLSLAKGKYKDAFINGAMLSLEDPTRQYEDVSKVFNTAVYRRLKEDLDISKLSDLLVNERTDVEVPNAYGAWWYSCIPVDAIEKNGLPMPFFIRCDDVEFGMRNQPVYMTMNCICVWHSSFEGRFRASVDVYQYVRNFAAMIALDDCASENYFILRLERDIRQRLRYLDYISAEFILDGFDDYLKGPEFLENLDGAALMKANGARNEKLVPIAELDQALLKEAGVTSAVLSNKNLEFHPRRLMKYVRQIPYDKHYLPQVLLRKKPGYAVINNTALLDGSAAGVKTLVVLDPMRKNGIVRHLDKERFRAIRAREHELLSRYRKEGSNVRRAWKEAKPYLTSREFWNHYLGLK